MVGIIILLMFMKSFVINYFPSPLKSGHFQVIGLLTNGLEAL